MKTENVFFDWYHTQASAEDRALIDKVDELSGDLFDDMLFRAGSITSDFVSIQASKDNKKTWFNDRVPLPDTLEYFSYEWFYFCVEDMKDANTQGYFDGQKQKLAISPAHANDDAAILHELIHLHEFVINDLPLFYHDVVLWCLYRDLRDKIDNLEGKLESHGHLWNENELLQDGGTHDILFLLKSFDLDLRKGYPLGTVFGYERTEFFSE